MNTRRIMVKNKIGVKSSALIIGHQKKIWVIAACPPYKGEEE